MTSAFEYMSWAGAGCCPDPVRRWRVPGPHRHERLPARREPPPHHCDRPGRHDHQRSTPAQPATAPILVFIDEPDHFVDWRSSSVVASIAIGSINQAAIVRKHGGFSGLGTGAFWGATALNVVGPVPLVGRASAGVRVAQWARGPGGLLRSEAIALRRYTNALVDFPRSVVGGVSQYV